MKRKPKISAPVDFGENSVAGYDLGPLMPSNRAESPMNSHDQLERLNANDITGFRWDIRFDGV